MEIYKPLIETVEDVKIIESTENNNKRLFLEGITLQAEVKNGNGRIYPMPILRESVNTYVNKFLKENRAVGELDHPSTNLHKINPDRISHKFVSVVEDGNNFITKALVLDTVCGKQVKNLVEGNVKIGMSQRGFGKTTSKNGVVMVEKLHLVALADIVVDPSAPEAFSQAIFENREWVYENGLLVERNVEPIIDEVKQLLENSSQEDKKIAIISMWKKYLAEIMIKNSK